MRKYKTTPAADEQDFKRFPLDVSPFFVGLNDERGEFGERDRAGKRTSRKRVVVRLGASGAFSSWSMSLDVISELPSGGYLLER